MLIKMISSVACPQSGFFDAYAGWGADLTLSGHIHGGIVRIPGIGGVISTSYRLFPKYDGGYYEQNQKR